MKKLLILFSLFCIAITGARADNSTDDGYYYDPESPTTVITTTPNRR